jgi:excisionase family DNA binding protein
VTTIEEQIADAVERKLAPSFDRLLELLERASAPKPALLPSPDRYVGVAEAAQFSGVEQQTIHAWIGRGLKAYKPRGSREYRIHLPELRAWIEGLEEPDSKIEGAERELVAVALTRLRGAM